MPQVGASNELPESEELDALYDRFLIRRQAKERKNRQFVLAMGSGVPVCQVGDVVRWG